MVQAVGCSADLRIDGKYCMKRRLCREHLKVRQLLSTLLQPLCSQIHSDKAAAFHGYSPYACRSAVCVGQQLLWVMQCLKMQAEIKIRHAC